MARHHLQLVQKKRHLHSLGLEGEIALYEPSAREFTLCGHIQRGGRRSHVGV